MSQSSSPRVGDCDMIMPPTSDGLEMDVNAVFSYFTDTHLSHLFRKKVEMIMEDEIQIMMESTYSTAGFVS